MDMIWRENMAECPHKGMNPIVSPKVTRKPRQTKATGKKVGRPKGKIAPAPAESVPVTTLDVTAPATA